MVTFADETKDFPLEAAIVIATEQHGGQLDKSGQPYILHCLRVMLAMPDLLGRIVAVLHDVPEDTDMTVKMIEHDFGPDVSRPVDALTRRPDETYMDYIKRVDKCPLARRVKIADLNDNLSPARMAGLEHMESMHMRHRRALNYLLDSERRELTLVAGDDKKAEVELSQTEG